MGNPKKDFCTVTDEVCQAETHLLLELRESSRINFIELLEKALTAAIKAIKSTLRVVGINYFSPQVVNSNFISKSHRNNHMLLLSIAKLYHELGGGWE